MDSFIKQLTSSSFWTLNKDLCRTIGLQNTLVLQHFIDLQYKLFGGKEFYQQQERIQEELGISERQVKQTIKYLLDEGFISVEKKGIPCKNYYLISEDKITSLVSSIQPNQSGQTDLTREDELTSQRKELIKKEKEKELIKIELIKKELKENKVEELNFGKYNNL
jgi:biotin operon repressor